MGPEAHVKGVRSLKLSVLRLRWMDGRPARKYLADGGNVRTLKLGVRNVRTLELGFMDVRTLGPGVPGLR